MAVLPSGFCIHRLGSWPNVCLTVLLSFIARTCADAGLSTLGKTENNGCTAVKSAYITKGLSRYDHTDIPTSPVNGWNLKICQQVTSCCTTNMELKFNTHSQQEFDEIMAEKITLIRENFISRTAKFDAFFTELLDNAKKDLHEMFVRTYGLLYQQNSNVFTDLFHDLKSYYKGRDINLLDALDKFFSTLLQKMFELLNSQYTFDDAYLQCVTEHMDELKPFGDVPNKLAVQVKRAFVAARTFVQGLAVGRDVIIAVSKLHMSQSCQKAITKMLYCPYCSGHPAIKPCNNYCMNVMKGCLAHHSELNQPWNDFIDALMKVATRLEGPFNIEMVVEPIDVKISDAIMNFQENSEAVSTKVFQGCGKPAYGRKKRNADSYNEDYFNNWNKYNEQSVRPTTASGTNLDRLVRDIKKKIKVAKDFWNGLPHGVCNDWAEPLFKEYNCWNGHRIAKYMPEVMRDGLMHQINNPEVEVDIRRPSSLINQQILQLKLITNKLDNAYNGLDVDWVDTADVFSSGSGGDDGSGAGSGAGSGYPPYGRTDGEFSFSQPDNDWSIKPLPTRRPAPGSRPDDDKRGYNNNDNNNNNNGYPTPSSAATWRLNSSILLFTFTMVIRWL